LIRIQNDALAEICAATADRFAAFATVALRHLIAETGPGQIMVGTDYPYGWTSTEIDLVLNTPDLSDDDRIAILGGTAARLLGIGT